MKKARRKECEICMSQLELRKGICKPCWASRGCAISGCDWINKEPDAAQCINCQQDKSSTTAKHVRVAMRCPVHATKEQGMFNLCNKCFQKQAKEADDVPQQLVTIAMRTSTLLFYITLKSETKNDHIGNHI